MHRIDSYGHKHNRFYIPEEGAIDDDKRTEFSAEWLNSVQEELCLLLEAFGIRLDKDNEGQVATLAKKLFSQQESRISNLEQRLESDLIGSKAYHEKQILALERRFFAELQMGLANQEGRLAGFKQKWAKETTSVNATIQTTQASISELAQGVKKRLDTQEGKVERLSVAANSLLKEVQGIKKP